MKLMKKEWIVGDVSRTAVVVRSTEFPWCEIFSPYFSGNRMVLRITSDTAASGHIEHIGWWYTAKSNTSSSNVSHHAQKFEIPDELPLVSDGPPCHFAKLSGWTGKPKIQLKYRHVVRTIWLTMQKAHMRTLEFGNYYTKIVLEQSFFEFHLGTWTLRAIMATYKMLHGFSERVRRLNENLNWKQLKRLFMIAQRVACFKFCEEFNETDLDRFSLRRALPTPILQRQLKFSSAVCACHGRLLCAIAFCSRNNRFMNFNWMALFAFQWVSKYATRNRRKISGISYQLYVWLRTFSQFESGPNWAIRFGWELGFTEVNRINCNGVHFKYHYF